MQKFTPIQYLMIDIANAFGLDKTDWNVRLAWFVDMESQIRADPMGWAQRAEEPAQFMAGLNAYEKAKAGIKTGYLCGLDATASGLQLLAILAGCEDGARICNVVNTGKREDAYNRLFAEICAILGSTSAVQRKAVKNALMTHLYGSKLEPKKAFGEDTPELAAFYTAIDTLLPGANQLNHDLISLWQPNAYEHAWVLPDGFDVKIKVEDTVVHKVQFLGESYEVNETVNQPKEKGLAMGANIIHSIDGMIVREMNRRCNFNEQRIGEIYSMLHCTMGGTYTLRKRDLDLLQILELFNQTKFMSAVVLEYLDEHNAGHLDTAQRQAVINLIDAMPVKSFQLLCIHDCFKFHANYGNDVREQYITILAEIAESEILSSIATQVRGIATTVNKLSNNLPTLIRQSEYALS